MKKLLILLLTLVPSMVGAQSTTSLNTYVSGLPTAGTLSGSEKFYCIQAGISKQCTLNQIISAPAGGDLLGTYPNPSVVKVNGATPPTGIWKNNPPVAAISGTDYAPATSGSSILLGNGAGGFSAYAGVSGITHQWISALSAAGGATQSQPACADISDAGAFCNGASASNLSSGTLPAARLGGMSAITASLGSDVALNNTANFFDGPSIAQGTSGTWFASGSVTLIDTAGIATIYCKLWDGTTVIDSIAVNTPGTSLFGTMHLSGSLVTPVANIRISCRDLSSTSGVMKFNQTGTSKDSTITAIRIN